MLNKKNQNKQENNKKVNRQKDILRILAEKPAVAMEELQYKLSSPPYRGGVPERQGGNSKKSPPPPDLSRGTPPQKGGEGKKYALTRSVKNLIEVGCVEVLKSDRQNYLKITSKGRAKLNSIRLEGEEALVPLGWDGFWRIIILDLPEERKAEREALRYLLKKANFKCLKNTVWLSPHPYENLFTNLKKDLGLSTELLIFVTDKIDPETNQAFLKLLKN